jgi:purine-binding chemotaxis protein CheW
MNDTLTIRKRAIADRLKEKLSDKMHGLPSSGGGQHASVSYGARASGQTMPPQPAEDIDPLVDFLARYDEGFEEDRAFEVDGTAPQLPVEDEKRFLSFDLAGEEYAASIMDIREILKVSALTDVPRAPEGILGVLSKRGVVMPVVDLAASIGLRAPDARMVVDQRILVVGHGDRVCGLRVDRVREVVRLGRARIEEVPPSLGARQAQMLVGLGKAADDRMLILLDMASVLDQLALRAGLQPLNDDRRRAEAV